MPNISNYFHRGAHSASAAQPITRGANPRYLQLGESQHASRVRQSSHVKAHFDNQINALSSDLARFVYNQSHNIHHSGSGRLNDGLNHEIRQMSQWAQTGNLNFEQSYQLLKVLGGYAGNIVTNDTSYNIQPHDFKRALYNVFASYVDNLSHETSVLQRSDLSGGDIDSLTNMARIDALNTTTGDATAVIRSLVAMEDTRYAPDPEYVRRESTSHRLHFNLNPPPDDNYMFLSPERESYLPGKMTQLEIAGLTVRQLKQQLDHQTNHQSSPPYQMSWSGYS